MRSTAKNLEKIEICPMERVCIGIKTRRQEGEGGKLCGEGGREESQFLYKKKGGLK